MNDLRYTATYVAGVAIILAGETHALRNRPGKKASVSAHLWWAAGSRYRPRWLLGLAVYLGLGAHVFYRWNPGIFDQSWPYIEGDTHHPSA